MSETREVVVLGGTGVAGREIVRALEAAGFSARPASRSSGVDVVAGTGLAEVLAGAVAVVDAVNATRRAEEVLITGTTNAVAAAEAAGVPHYVLLAIVGSEHVPLAYYRSKVRQEALVRDGAVPSTIVRATQFHPFVAGIVRGAGRFGVLPAPSARLQPVDPRDVARTVVGTIEAGPSSPRTIVGPEVLTVAELARQAGVGRRLPVPLPGRVGRALRAGALTDEHAPRGSIAFRDRSPA